MTTFAAVTRRDLFRDPELPRRDRRGPVNPASPGFGYQLRWHRDQAGLSQGQLAIRANRNAGYISYLEAGTRTPSPDMIASIVTALGLPARDAARMYALAGLFPPGVAVEDVVRLVRND